MKYIYLIENIFNKKNIAAVCVSHSIYLIALPARIAIKYGVQAFQVNAQSIYRLTFEYPCAGTNTKNYRQTFVKLPKNIQELGIVAAQNQLKRRFSGEVGVDMPYSRASAYSTINNNLRFLKENSKFKVLIAIHDFYDAPHAFGTHFYPDFYLWLEALAKIARDLDYEWYIKTHPDTRGQGAQIIKKFTNNNGKFIYLSPDTDHHSLIKEGIGIALTVCGTIGSEYPYLGVPVLNASINHPHNGYKFSITPNSKIEYESIVRNLRELSYEISKKDILEFYFMHNIYKVKSWIFIDFERCIKEIGGYDNYIYQEILEYYLYTNNKFPVDIIRNALLSFLKSNSVCLDQIHLDSSFNYLINDLKKKNHYV